MAKISKPEVEVVRFRGGAEVIATSGVSVTLSGLGDNEDITNNTITVGGKSYSYGNSDGLEDALKAASGDERKYDRFSRGQSSIGSYNLLNMDNAAYDYFNGTYTWYTEGRYWQWDHK